MGRAALGDGEIRKAIEEECALTVGDVLERRARANLFASDNGLDRLDAVAGALAARAGWKDARREAEITAYRSRVAEDLAWRAGA
jgi:glycerol-3-phosphate dehydrogenase